MKNIQLLQNCLTDTQLAHLMPGFKALDFRHNPRPECREFQIFEALMEAGVPQSHDLLGAVSSRFQAKTRLNGLQVRQWITAHPGYEVYGVHPWPQWQYLHFNSFERAHIIHGPDFTARTQQVLDAARIPINATVPGRQHNRNLCMSSYWFGTPRFWGRFMSELVLPIMRLSPRELGSELHDYLYGNPLPYYGLSNHRAGALPFVLERLTSLYIAAAFPGQALYYQRDLPQILESCLFPFERDLITQFHTQVDAWDAAGVYDTEAMRYFDRASRHGAHGWLTYMLMHPVSFDHGDPRPRLPWFARQAPASTSVTPRPAVTTPEEAW